MGKTRFNRKIGKKHGPWYRGLLSTATDTATRQRRHASDQKEAFKYMASQFGGEPRRTRRAMAFALANKKPLCRCCPGHVRCLFGEA